MVEYTGIVVTAGAGWRVASWPDASFAFIPGDRVGFALAPRDVDGITRPGRKMLRWMGSCWGSCIYPAEAFAPGGDLEIRLVEEGREDRPEVVRLPHEVHERLWADSRNP